MIEMHAVRFPRYQFYVVYREVVAFSSRDRHCLRNARQYFRDQLSQKEPIVNVYIGKR